MKWPTFFLSRMRSDPRDAMAKIASPCQDRHWFQEDMWHSQVQTSMSDAGLRRTGRKLVGQMTQVPVLKSLSSTPHTQSPNSYKPTANSRVGKCCPLRLFALLLDFCICSLPTVHLLPHHSTNGWMKLCLLSLLIHPSLSLFSHQLLT